MIFFFMFFIAATPLFFVKALRYNGDFSTNCSILEGVEFYLNWVFLS
jgi:hypothetical protein